MPVWLCLRGCGCVCLRGHTLQLAADQEQLVKDVRGIVDSSLGGNAFVFSYPILLWEVWTVLLSQLVLNLSETFLAIFVPPTTPTYGGTCGSCRCSSYPAERRS